MLRVVISTHDGEGHAVKRAYNVLDQDIAEVASMVSEDPYSKMSIRRIATADASAICRELDRLLAAGPKGA